MFNFPHPKDFHCVASSPVVSKYFSLTSSQAFSKSFFVDFNFGDGVLAVVLLFADMLHLAEHFNVVQGSQLYDDS